MRTRRFVIAVAAVLSGCGQPTEAANLTSDSRSSGQRATPVRFDVAGVHVGDSVDAAAATLRQRGWVVDIPRGGWSFEDYVRRAQAQAAGRSASPRLDGPQALSARKDGEFIFARVRASPSGGIIETVSYTSPGAGRTREQILAEVQARYGPGVRRTPRSADWRICVRAEPACGRNPSQFNHIQFEVGPSSRSPFFPELSKGGSGRRASMRRCARASARRSLRTEGAGPSPHPETTRRRGLSGWWRTWFASWQKPTRSDSYSQPQTFRWRSTASNAS
jgi:hypothetical protein